MENLNVFITRIAVAALTSALFCAAAVFFVVDISLRGVETAIIATNERFDDVGARVDDVNARLSGIEGRFSDVNTRFDSLELSVERSTDVLREELQAGFATIGKDMRSEIERRDLEQDEWVRITASTLARLSVIMLEGGRNGSSETPEMRESLDELRVQVTIICRDVLGRDHPDCARLR